MIQPTYTPGQRWISDTESELGLGIIVEKTNRRVTLSFPAAGEQRIYAEDNAPISRVQYQIGEQVSSNSDETITITDVVDNNGCLIYIGANREGEDRVIPELELDCFVHFNSPKERLFAGQIDNPRRFRLRLETLSHSHRLQQNQVHGLIGPRVQLLPHQLYIAHTVANRYAPRVLLADEVGLGKTIEAGLILHQQLTSGRANRIMIVVPESLVYQWLVEMLRRFNLAFTVIDKQRCNELIKSGVDNPFDSAQLILCALSFLENNEVYHQQALSCEWDLLVVDEAHHLVWHEQSASHAYIKIEQLAQRAKGLLLLTATPEQLGKEGHFARLRLLDPDRYHDLQHFLDEQAQYQPVNDLVQYLLQENAADEFIQNPTLQQQLQHYLGKPIAEAVLEQLQSGDRDTINEACTRATQILLDQHGTGRVLFRNTRTTIKGFPERQLIRHPIAAPNDFQQRRQGATLEQCLYPEKLLGGDWVNSDPRITWLSHWLTQQRAQKVLLICANASTARELEQHLRRHVGIRSTVFHEGLDLLERDRAAAYFTDEEEGAQLLVCSEIGSEGRNFQFTHNLVLFDLPLNPDLLEQRIGRLDRIGQRHDININVPYYEHSPQEALMRWYDEGLDIFRRACPAGQTIVEHFFQSLQTLLMSDNPTSQNKLTDLINQTRTFSNEIFKQLQQGRDRLLELNSCNNDQANEIVDQLVKHERRHELANYMESVFNEYGVEHEYHSENAIIIQPGDHMQCSHFPALTEGGLTATYQRTQALSREDMHFLTWEHPMVTGAMDMILSDEFGNTTLCTLKLPPLKPGTILLEAVFTLHCFAPKALQLQRYMPLQTVRIVVDSSNNDLSEIVSLEHLNQLGEKVPKPMARDLIRHARGQITELIAQTEVLAQARQSSMIAEGMKNMRTLQDAEVQRLIGLSEINPNIRREEIEYSKSAATHMAHYIESAQIKLDALRVAIAT